MRYADYKAKLIRRKAFMKKLIKFIPLIAVLIIGLVAIITIISINYGNVNDTNDYTYNLGDTIDINGKAFMSKTYTEYYDEELDNWGDTPMKHAGIHKYRVISKANHRKYKEGTYLILQKEILVYIKDESITFGAKPTLVSDDLINDDYISSCEFEYESLIYSNTRIKPINETVKISDADGNDVTGDYIVLSEYQAIEIKACPILIKVESNSYTYDGKPKTFADPKVEINIDGVSLKSISYNKSYTNVGTYTLDVSDIDLELEYNDMEFTNYQIILEKETTLTITPKDVTVITNDYSKTYDGQFYETSYEIEGEYYDTISSVISKVIMVGTWDNEATITFVDSLGNDVSNNYNIKYDYGTVTIKKANLTVKPDAVAVEYDGFSHGFTKIDVSLGLAASDEISIINSCEYVDCIDLSTNNYEISIKNNLLNIDTKNCYDINFESSNIKITPRTVTIKIQDLTFEYSSEEFGLAEDNYQIISGSLVSGDLLKIYSNDTITNIGTIDANLSYFVVLRDDIDISSNYNILSNTFKLMVVPRPITIGSGNEYYEFDMQKHSLSSGEIISGSLIEGHKIDYISNESYVDIGEYVVSVSESIIYDENDNDVTSYYDISYNSGKLFIEAIKLKIKLLDRSVTYNGLQTITYKKEDMEIISGKILDGYVFDANYSIEVNTPATILIKPSVDDISITYNGESVINNYKIEFVESSLTILKRAITITSGSIIKEYSNTPLTYNAFEIVSGSLISGDSISVNITGVLTKIGKTKNTISDINIYDENGKNITSYYVITKVEGELQYVYKMD